MLDENILLIELSFGPKKLTTTSSLWSWTSTELKTHPYIDHAILQPPKMKWVF